jgi:hypothetical protein
MKLINRYFEQIKKGVFSMVGKPKVEDFICAYASTCYEPSEGEIALVKVNFKKITDGDPDNVIRKEGSWFCGCTDDEMFLDETFKQYFYIWEFHIPIEFIHPEFDPNDPQYAEERTLYVLQCSNCGKWALAD